MKFRKTILFLAIFIGKFAFSSVDGSQLYKPTALERMNIYCSSLATQKSGYYSSCLMEKPNTIKVSIAYWDLSKKKEAKEEFIPISFY